MLLPITHNSVLTWDLVVKWNNSEEGTAPAALTLQWSKRQWKDEIHYDTVSKMDKQAKFGVCDAPPLLKWVTLAFCAFILRSIICRLLYLVFMWLTVWISASHPQLPLKSVEI